MFVQILQKPFRKNQNSNCQDNGNEDILRRMDTEIVAGKAGQQDQEYTEVSDPVSLFVFNAADADLVGNYLDVCLGGMIGLVESGVVSSCENHVDLTLTSAWKNDHASGFSVKTGAMIGMVAVSSEISSCHNYGDITVTKEASFNFDLFKEHVHKAMHLMDDIIDLELEKVEQIINKVASDPEEADIRHVEHELWKKIKDMALRGRRTGLGITAEGDMLAALGLRYGSDEAIDFAVSVHRTLAVEAYRASVKMAEERGAFPIYDAAREASNPMIQRIKEVDPELYEQMVKYGRRNIAMLTIAPTGTTSLMSQTTSGIEPVFRPVYKRRRKINPSDRGKKADFIDEMGEKFEEYYVYHHQFVKWLEQNGYKAKGAWPVDMFPHTHHVETVVALKRK